LPLLENIIKEYKKAFNREFTRFEILTSIALLYFYEENCDIVILEVGLGGKFDCTNIVHPIISAFGSISFDHMSILGNTLEKIAIEKAGIIKENSNSVIFNQKAVSIIKEICLSKNNNLNIIYENEISNYNYDNIYQYFKYKNLNITLNLKGKKQIENACVVLECIQILKENNFKINDKNIITSLQNIYHPARYEIINKNPLTIFDGAHNENAIDNFISITKDLYKNCQKTFVVSIIKTKDYKTILEKLLTAFPDSTYIFTSGNNLEKFLSSDILFEEATRILPNNKNLYTDNFKEAISSLQSEVNFIVGSFYTYSSINLK